MTIFTANVSLLSCSVFAAVLMACAPSDPAGVPASSEAMQAGISRYTLVADDTSDVLQEQNAGGAVLGTWARNRNTGVATQTWADPLGNVWQLSSATGCLRRRST